MAAGADPAAIKDYWGRQGLGQTILDEATGVLAPVGWESTQGKTPRFIGLDPSGGFLCAANQESDTIVVFRVDLASGKPAPTGGVVNVGSPSTIVFHQEGK